MGKNIVSRIFCKDEKYLWCYDDAIGALSRINIETMDVDCVLPSFQILIEKGYEIGKLIEWKNKIIMVPTNIGKKWPVYDKMQNNLEYVYFCFENYLSGESILKEDELIIIPISPNNPVLIVDLSERKVIKKFFFLDRKAA